MKWWSFLRALWKKYPGWRIAQLVLNANAAANGPDDAYSAKDDVLDRGLRRLLGGGPSDDGGESASSAA